MMKVNIKDNEFVIIIEYIRFDLPKDVNNNLKRVIDFIIKRYS